MASSNNFDRLNERELVTKANEALDKMKEGHELGPKGTKVVGARKLRKGGVIYELNSAEAARWLRREKAAFTVGVGGTSVVKERVVDVIVEYVPTSFNPDALAEGHKIETDSGLSRGSFALARWIKPLRRRAPGQRMAHLIAHFTTLADVNKVIKDGIIIVGKRVWACRMKREPKRCLKCQALNSDHFSAECKGRDTCGTCGGEHHTAECSEDNQSQYSCTN